MEKSGIRKCYKGRYSFSLAIGMAGEMVRNESQDLKRIEIRHIHSKTHHCKLMQKLKTIKTKRKTKGPIFLV